MFPAALLGRVVTIPYRPLGDDLLRAIVKLQLERIAARVACQHGAALRFDPDVVSLLAQRCTERESGARNVEALLASTLLPRLSEGFLTRMLTGSKITEVSVSARDGELACAFH